jgi:hypothetical protein
MNIGSLKIRSCVALTLVCGGLVVHDAFLPRAALFATQAKASEGIRSVASVCEWNDIEWRDMTPAEQQAWMALGWTGNTWGSDDPALAPAAISKEWLDLSASEKQAAEALGFRRENWNVEPDPFEGR